MHDFFHVPCRAHPAAGVAGGEEPEQLGAAVVVEAVIGSGQQPPSAIQRIAFAGAMAEHFPIHLFGSVLE